jgi:hypothetical protein
MKRLVLILFLVTFIMGINTACHKFGESAKAFETYKASAEPETREEYKEERRLAHKRYGASPTVPNLMSIEYNLMSAESEGEGQLRLKVSEILHYEHPDEKGRPGRLNEHDVLMEKGDDGSWEVVEVEIQNLGERLQ